MNEIAYSLLKSENDELELQIKELKDDCERKDDLISRAINKPNLSIKENISLYREMAKELNHDNI